MYNVIYDHLVINGLTTDSEWGFSPGKSTTTALVATFHQVLSDLDKGLDVSILFLDIKKAFDSVPHLPLLNKLKQINLHPIVLQWLSSYLFNRRQVVAVDGVFSGATTVTSGVPQGSVLGPLLFLIYINEVSQLKLSEGTSVTSYADDIMMYKPITCAHDYGKLQTDINSIYNCISARSLTLNPEKCKYLVCSKKSSPTLPPSGLHLNNEVLERVRQYRYLGVLVTERLSWNDHISNICKKARKLIGMLYRQFYAWADKSSLKTIYLTSIRPHLEYACQLWDPQTASQIQSLESVQKFACKVHVCLKRWDMSYTDMLIELDLPPLKLRRQLLFKINHSTWYLVQLLLLSCKYI